VGGTLQLSRSRRRGGPRPRGSPRRLPLCHCPRAPRRAPPPPATTTDARGGARRRGGRIHRRRRGGRGRCGPSRRGRWRRAAAAARVGGARKSTTPTRTWKASARWPVTAHQSPPHVRPPRGVPLPPSAKNAAVAVGRRLSPSHTSVTPYAAATADTAATRTAQLAGTDMGNEAVRRLDGPSRPRHPHNRPRRSRMGWPLARGGRAPRRPLMRTRGPRRERPPSRTTTGKTSGRGVTTGAPIDGKPGGNSGVVLPSWPVGGPAEATTGRDALASGGATLANATAGHHAPPPRHVSVPAWPRPTGASYNHLHATLVADAGPSQPTRRRRFPQPSTQQKSVVELGTAVSATSQSGHRWHIQSAAAIVVADVDATRRA